MTHSNDGPRQIRTGTVELTATAHLPGGLFRPAQKQSKSWTVLDSRTLVKTLRVIQDGSSEEHVKNNIQTLIDQVYDARLDA
jgi:hypothetical protein